MDQGTSIDDLPRFSPVSFNDHAGQLWIVTILSLVYSLLVVLARAYIKYKMFGFDDILIASAAALHLAQSIATFIGLANGLGKFNSITTAEQWAVSSKSVLAATVLCLLALSLAKCSLLALILRIIGPKGGLSKPFCISLMGLSAAWGVGSFIAFLANCRADTLLTVDNVTQCPNQNVRWTVITVVDIITEICTWILVVQLTWTVNMSVARKIQVIMAFSFRVPLVALSALHLAYFWNYPTSNEPQFAITNSLLFLQSMLVWSLISATVPNLKNFLKSFSIGMGFPLAFDISMYGSNNTYPLQSLGNSRARTMASAVAGAAGASTSVSAHDPSDGDFRAKPHNWTSDQVPSRDEASEEGRSSRAGSQEMIINKEVTWKITYEDH